MAIRAQSLTGRVGVRALASTPASISAQVYRRVRLANQRTMDVYQLGAGPAATKPMFAWRTPMTVGAASSFPGSRRPSAVGESVQPEMIEVKEESRS